MHKKYPLIFIFPIQHLIERLGSNSHVATEKIQKERKLNFTAMWLFDENENHKNGFSKNEGNQKVLTRAQGNQDVPRIHEILLRYESVLTKQSIL